MKTRIALGAGLLLTLGTAVAGTIFYGQSGQAQSDEYGASHYHGQYRTGAQYHSSQPVRSAEVEQSVAAPASDPSQPTPEMIAMWKATAASTDYISPKAPI
jgi:hypothetical protein